MAGKTRKKGMPKAQRKILCRDSLPWLAEQKGMLDSVVASIPEMEEVGLKKDAYVEFFRKAARLCLEAVKPTGFCVFLQTDRKKAGWIDKSYLIADEAAAVGSKMLWHKIALRVDVGKKDIFRPGYSHMLCFSVKGPVGPLLPDVVARGSVSYKHAFGLEAVRLVIGYLKAQGVKHVVDPFVGSGTTVAVANEAGLKATGLDIDKKQCAAAAKMKVE
jgi:hypothetical protein